MKNNNERSFVCQNNNFSGKVKLIISDELKNKYQNQINDILNDKSNNNDKYFNLAILYRNIGNLEQSCKMYLKDIKINPNNFLSFSGLGTVYQEMGNYQLAERAFMKALEINNQDIGSYIKLVFLYKSSLKKTQKEIIDFYKKSILKTKGNVDLARDYASYLEEIGKYGQAIKIWKAIIEREGESKIVKDKINKLEKKMER